MFEVTFANSAITIIAPTEMLSQYSQFFRIANNFELQPDGTKKILLEKVAPETFAMLLSWLYKGGPSQGIEFCQPPNGCWDEELKTDIQIQIWNRLLDGYLLMEFLKSPVLANSIMGSILKLLEQHEEFSKACDGLRPDSLFTLEERTKTINRVWNQTSTDSPLRRIVIDQIAYSGYSYNTDHKNIYSHSTPDEADAEIKLKVPTDFFWDLLEELQNATQIAARDDLVPIGYPWERGRCFYHSRWCHNGTLTDGRVKPICYSSGTKPQPKDCSGICRTS